MKKTFLHQSFAHHVSARYIHRVGPNEEEPLPHPEINWKAFVSTVQHLCETGPQVFSPEGINSVE